MGKLTNFVAGMVIPIRVTSRLYLSEQLAKQGVQVTRIPAACLQELADEGVATAKSIAALSHRAWRGMITEYLDGFAINLAAMLDGTYQYESFSEDYDDHLLQIFGKHGVAIGGPSHSDD